MSTTIYALVLAIALPTLACAGGDPDVSHALSDEKELEPDQFELPTRTGYFLEIDGVDPETPACHPFFTSDLGCEESTRDRSGDIWEMCEGGDWLVETGPEAGACHMHAFGVGHPHSVSCSAYCLEAYGLWGSCQTAPMDCGEGGNKDIGYCECVPLCGGGGSGLARCTVEDPEIDTVE